MKNIFKIDIQKCMGQLNLSNNMKKALIEQYIKDFLDLNKKTLQNIFFNNKTPYSINKDMIVNQELFSVSVKVKFIKEGKKSYKEILVYDIDEVKTSPYSRFRKDIDKQILKIDVNTITNLFIIIKYKY